MVCHYCGSYSEYWIHGGPYVYCSWACVDAQSIKDEKELQAEQRAQEQQDFIRQQSEILKSNKERDDLERDISGLIDYFTFYKTRAITTDVFPEVRSAYNRALSYINGNYDFSIKAKTLLLKDVLSQVQNNYEEGKRQYQPIQDKLDKEQEINRLKNEIQKINNLINNPHEIGNNFCTTVGKGIILTIDKVIFDLKNDVMLVNIPAMVNQYNESRTVTLSVYFIDDENREKEKNNQNDIMGKKISSNTFAMQSGITYSYKDDGKLKISLTDITFENPNIYIMISDSIYTYATYIFDNTDCNYGPLLRQIKSKQTLQNEINAHQSKINELQGISKPQQSFSNTSSNPFVSLQNFFNISNNQNTTSQGNTSQSKTTTGADVTIAYSVSSSALGKEVDFDIPTKNACIKCKGTGKIPMFNICPFCSGRGYHDEKKRISVKIPADFQSGNIIRIKGMGNPGINGDANGDFCIKLNLK